LFRCSPNRSQTCRRCRTQRQGSFVRYSTAHSPAFLCQIDGHGVHGHSRTSRMNVLFSGSYGLTAELQISTSAFSHSVPLQNPLLPSPRDRNIFRPHLLRANLHRQHGISSPRYPMRTTAQLRTLAAPLAKSLVAPSCFRSPVGHQCSHIISLPQHASRLPLTGAYRGVCPALIPFFRVSRATLVHPTSLE